METMISNTRSPIVAGADAATSFTASIPPVTSPVPGKTRVAISFVLTDTDALLIVDSERIVASMTGNPAYPAPDPTLAEVNAVRTAYIAAVSAAQDSTIAISARTAQRAILTALLRKLAHYVQTTSNGDRTTLLSSGFPAQRIRAPIGKLLAPMGLTLTRGKLSGQVTARCRKHPKAGAYHWRIGPTATPMLWQPIDTTLAAHIAYDSLVQFTQYTAQVRAIGTAGPSDWSDVATVVVL